MHRIETFTHIFYADGGRRDILTSFLSSLLGQLFQSLFRQETGPHRCRSWQQRQFGLVERHYRNGMAFSGERDVGQYILHNINPSQNGSLNHREEWGKWTTCKYNRRGKGKGARLTALAKRWVIVSHISSSSS